MRGLGDGVGLAVVPVGGGGAWPGFETTRRAAEQRPGPTGVEGAGGTGGHGRGARGWRQGQGGPRDRSLRAAGSRVAISRAGRRPPAHTAARPTEAGPAARMASGRAAAHRHTQRPGLPRQALRRGRLAGGPPPTGTQSDQTELGRSCAVDGGHPKQPGLTRQKIRQPEVWQLVQRLNSAQDAQQFKPQKHNEKRPPSHQRSQLHSNTHKSHMRNMRAS